MKKVVLSNNAKEVLGVIMNCYCGIAARTGLEVECDLPSATMSKDLSRAISELRRKGYIKVFRSTEPSDRFIYKATAKGKKVSVNEVDDG